MMQTIPTIAPTFIVRSNAIRGSVIAIGIQAHGPSSTGRASTEELLRPTPTVGSKPQTMENANAESAVLISTVLIDIFAERIDAVAEHGITVAMRMKSKSHR
jgi:hypothetical protein